MIKRFLTGLIQKPGEKHGRALSLGYCFTVISVVLIIISSNLSSAYLNVLKQERANTLSSYAAILGVDLSGQAIQEGMVVDLALPDYSVNVYTKAGNSFKNVYSSQNHDSPTLEIDNMEDGNKYRQAFDKQELIVVRRSDTSGLYVAAVSPIINTDGTSAGLVEVLMTSAAFGQTNQGMSLSWLFTIFAIAVSLTIVFYQIRNLMDTVMKKPDKMLPKIIRYGMSGCQSIAFFSSAAVTLPAIVISKNIYMLAHSQGITDGSRVFMLAFCATMFFALGFFFFSGIKHSVFKLFTARMGLLFAVLAGSLLLLISAFANQLIVYLILLFPMGFCMGLVFFFQREYRIYASRLGYKEFSERKIHNIQYYGYLLGSSVGAVFAGVFFDRFGWRVVALVSVILLFVVLIEALLFVQHCPTSNPPRLFLPTYLYALSNRRSGTFVWSAVLPMGVQLAFFAVFLPWFLNVLGMSLATVSFYYIVFFFTGVILVQLLSRTSLLRLSMNSRVFVSAALQICGYVLFALSPTAKILVVVVGLFGFSMGLHEFRYLSYYRKMIVESKHELARGIVERTFTVGSLLGVVLFNLAIFVSGIVPLDEGGAQIAVADSRLRIGLLIVAFVMSVLVLGYPIMMLVYAPSNSKQNRRNNDEG